jgi:hypothetical protein
MTIPSEDFKWCRVCKDYKPNNEVTENTIKGKDQLCKIHYNEYNRAYRAKNSEKNNKYHREWRANLGDKYKETCINRRKNKIAAMTEEELLVFRKYENEKAKRLSLKIKDEVYNAYGGYKCACCGETQKLFLSIDHVLNDGNEHRKINANAAGGDRIYRWLKKNNYPKDFQILCMNCNTGKHRNNGICPHKNNV